VRELNALGKGADFTWKKTKALEFGGFFAGLEECLEAETNTEEGDTALDGSDEWCAKVLLVEGADQGGVMADTGKNDGGGVGDGFGGAGALRGGAEALEGAFDARDVACAVV
jgi:hypothetical protein